MGFQAAALIASFVSVVVPAMAGSATATSDEVVLFASMAVSDEVVLFEHAPARSMRAAGIAIILALSRIH